MRIHRGLIGVLWVAAAVRLHGLGAQSVWFDEGWSAYAAIQPTLWDAANADLTNPPLYYSLIYLSATLTGTTAFALRWLSLAFGMIAVALAARLGRGATNNRQAAWVAAAVAGVAPSLVWASQEMRMYTLLAVLVAVCALGWEQLRTQPTRGAWAALLLAELAALYTHNTGPVIALWLNSVTLAAWAVGRRPPPRRWIAGQAVVGLLWLPYFVRRFLLLTDANRALVRQTAPDSGLWAGLWLAPWEAVIDGATPALWATLLPAVLLASALRTARGRWLVLHLVVLLAGLLAGLAGLGNELHGRYLVMLVPIAAAAVGMGAAHLPRPLTALAGGLTVAALLTGYPALRSPAYSHDDARAMVAHYAETLTAEDTVLAWSYADRYELAYYWDRLNVAAQRVTLPEGASLATVEPLLPVAGDVSLNVWYTQRADYRGMLDCVLSHGTPHPPETFTVNGMTTLTYREPNTAPPPTRPTDTRFTVGLLTSVGRLPSGFHAGQPACVPVELVLERATPAELKAALVVRNALGVEISNTSSVFATANGRTSIDETAGETLTAYPILRLPPGTPPDRYSVALRAFDETALSGYDRLAGGAPAGKEYVIGTWTVAPGAVWDVPPVDGWVLDSVDLSAAVVQNGAPLDITLTWRRGPDVDGPPPNAELRATDGSWRVAVPTTTQATDNLTVEWRRVRLPVDAPAGEAVLVVDGVGEAARVTLEAVPVISQQPPADEPLNAVFPGVGRLAGYTVRGDRATGVTVELVWEAGPAAPSEGDYTVFVQLLNGQGEIIAQSDAPPAGGNRPTSSWRPGEFIIDAQTLRFNERPTPTTATLIVGLYDAAGRIPPTNGNGTDYAQARLPVALR